MEEYYDAYVCEHVYMHKYKIRDIRQIRFEDTKKETEKKIEKDL